MGQETTRDCSYQYDPVESLSPTKSVNLPRSRPDKCSHPAAKGEADRCLFHSHDREFPPDAIVEEFLEIIDASDQNPVFAGGRFGDLDLSGETLTTPSGEPIDLRGATIDGTLSLNGTTIEVPLLLGQAAITGSIEAEEAIFQAPVDLSQASVGGSLHLHNATFEAGVAANDLDGGFVDGRALSATGSVVFDEATFAANVQLGRSQFHSDLSFAGAEFDRLVDCTALSAAGDVSFAQATIGEEATFIASTISGDLSVSGLQVANQTDFSHAVLDGDISGENASFDGGVLFKDARCRGAHLDFEGAEIGDRLELSYVDCSETSVSLRGTAVEGEAWFTHATFEGPVTLDDGHFADFVHLRDAEFHDDLSLRDATFPSQSYLHGSTVGGDIDATNTEFDHFQFSATVAGDAEFSEAQFDSRGLFSNSEVGGTATFDRASFAGNPDFSDSRFKGPVSFEDTEFLVEPTFEGTRFAVDPDLDAASYPQDSFQDLEEHRRNIIVARPEDLRNHGMTLSIDAVSDDPVIPASDYGLLQPSGDLAKAITGAMNALDWSAWNDLFERATELSRTAVSELPNDGPTTLVYGLSIATDGDQPSDFLDHGKLVGVYQLQKSENQVQFSYLDPDLDALDFLIAVPASDSPFESGVSVGVRAEFRKAIVRRQVLQTALLEQDDPDLRFVNEFLPVLVATGRAE
jgi:hypothetical protein